MVLIEPSYSAEFFLRASSFGNRQAELPEHLASWLLESYWQSMNWLQLGCRLAKPDGLLIAHMHIATMSFCKLNVSSYDFDFKEYVPTPLSNVLSGSRST